MGIAVLILFYGSAFFCVGALVSKFIKYKSMPMHLHWEIYDRGSIYELLNWQGKPSLQLGEKIKSIISSLFFLKIPLKQGKVLWISVIIFHAGTYLLVAWHVWLFVSAILLRENDNPSWAIWWGHISTTLVLFGIVGILIKRIWDVNLRRYYSPLHFFKWVLLILTMGGGFYAVQFHFQGDISSLLNYVRDQLSFDLAYKVNAPVPTSIHLLLAAPWLIYLPFSHVTRLFDRYYNYIHWDGKPNKDIGVQKQIRLNLSRPITWAGKHIQSGKNWASVATESPKEYTDVGQIHDKND